MAEHIKSNEYWGQRSGTYSADIPKGHTRPWGNVFRQQQWGSGRSNNPQNNPELARRKRNKCGVKL